jgi:hypothetical protein
MAMGEAIAVVDARVYASDVLLAAYLNLQGSTICGIGKTFDEG